MRASSNDDRFETDSSGIVYERTEGGIRIIGTCTQLKGSLAIRDDVVAIGDHAFVHQRLLESVTLPPGITSIGARAFFECERLSQLAIPPTVEEIGDEAFCFTDLKEVHLPDNLHSLGCFAFSRHAGTSTTKGREEGRAVLSATRGRGAELLITELPQHGENGWRVRVPPRFEASPACKRFAVMGGFLCSRNPDETTFKALSYSGGRRKVTVDKRINAIGPHALEGAEDICELVLHLGIRRIEDQGLTLPYPLECLTIDELDGNMTRLYPACDLAGKIAQSSCFTIEGIDLARLTDSCDLTLLRMLHGYERLRRIIARLENGRYLSTDIHDAFEHVVFSYFEKNIALLASHDDVSSIQRLFELGAVNADNVTRAVEIAGQVGSTPVTHCLLEERKRRFNGRLLDLRL